MISNPSRICGCVVASESASQLRISGLLIDEMISVANSEPGQLGRTRSWRRGGRGPGPPREGPPKADNSRTDRACEVPSSSPWLASCCFLVGGNCCSTGVMTLEKSSLDSEGPFPSAATIWDPPSDRSASCCSCWSRCFRISEIYSSVVVVDFRISSRCQGCRVFSQW